MKLCTWLWTLAGLCAAAAVGQADEGMWLFNNPPRHLLKEKYGFVPSDAWLEHVQKSAVRFNSGGSGSFVSADGLVMTNHHVGADCLHKLSDEKHNYYRDGFLARTLAEEKRCLDLELNVLMSIEDVTARVNAAVKPGMSASEAAAARRAVMAEIEKESTEKTGLRSDVITLYQGGQYHLYRFKRYTDVRLVMAPEQQIAFFGGDPDNFEYPRYDLDVCFFRVYENGKPVRVEHYLKWSAAGAREGELVFVAGHPGRTDRLNTVAELEYMRDIQYPNALRNLNRLEVMLSAYSSRSEENARQAKDFLFSVQNSRKAREGGLAGLLDPRLMARKRDAEQKLRAAAPADAQGAWDQIAQAQKVIAQHAARFNALERGLGFNSTLFDIARTLVRHAAERTKPNSERLREYRDSNRESLELQLFSEEPLYDDFEIVKLADSLTWLASQLGYDSPLMQAILAGKAPRQRAVELVKGSHLKAVAERKRLYGGGQSAIDAARDPMIELARIVDAEAREVRKIIEAQDEIKRQAYAQIARAKFAIEGTNTYPDATFTLRLAFGVVKGYEENGQHVPFQTTYAGLYERSRQHHNRPPFDLPPRWIERKDKLDLQTPLNFVCTADIIGGNSGSPVINRDAEVVGLIFDGNIHSLVLDFIYTEEQARAVSVHSRGIIEALRKVYDAHELADELVKGKR
ncbi:MAG: S46 family peptidase [Gemmataceae bacterium]|nr:S46 family peptidase [Gemmataceae bacterium]MDW8264143.1 S46 family peptidase [Gemmataceae bacterium]